MLYGYMAGLRNGGSFSDTYIMGALQISKAVLYRRKKELMEKDLILVDKVDFRTYILYVGYTDVPARQVKKQWRSEEDNLFQNNE